MTAQLPAHPTHRKFWFFFYGLPNIFGLSGLLIGLVCHSIFMVMYRNDNPYGTPDWFWIGLLICTLLYVAGWLMGWWIQDNDADLHFEQTLTAEQIEHELNQLLGRIQNRIPPEAYALVQRIDASVRSVLPQLVAGSVANQDLHTVRQAVFDYLPTTLENYLRLPTVYANMHPLQNGKTAKILLIEQLELLNQGINDATHGISQGDAQALLANQRFLQTRLGIETTSTL